MGVIEMSQTEKIYAGAITIPQTKSQGREKAKQVTAFSELKMHLRRCAVIMFNTICGNIIFYLIIGFINRLIPGRPIRSIFLFYSVNEAYLRTMIYPWYAPIVRWRPGLGQIIKQNGFWCLSFGITANEKDYHDSKNKNRLVKLYKDVNRIRRIIGAEQMSFSGQLPGIFVRRGIMSEDKSPENKNTVKAVTRAVLEVVKKVGMPETSPVIILGSKGFIGRTVLISLESRGKEVYPVDVNDGSQFPMNLAGKPVIIVNITKRGILQDYMPLLWKEVVLLNEVYPEPSEKEIEQLKARGVSCYHISGVRGRALPGFGRAYSGAIPCCASYIKDNFEVILKKLS